MFWFQTGETLAIAKTCRLGQLHNKGTRRIDVNISGKANSKMTIEA